MHKLPLLHPALALRTPYDPHFWFGLYLFVSCSGGAASCCGPWQVLCERTWTPRWGPYSNGSWWSRACRKISTFCKNTQPQHSEWRNMPNWTCRRHNPNVSKAETLPLPPAHLIAFCRSFVGPEVPGTRQKADLVASFNVLISPSHGKMVCGAVWLWFGFVQSCTRLLGSCEHDGAWLHQQLRNKEAREILGTGGKWQAVASYNFLSWHCVDCAMIYGVVMCCFLGPVFHLGHFPHIVSREEDDSKIDLSTLRPHDPGIQTHPVYFTAFFMVSL